MRRGSSGAVAADVLTKVPSPRRTLPFALSALIPYFLLSLSCQSKRYASSYSLAGQLSSLSLSPSILSSLYSSFSFEHALLRNNEGIYFINTGYPPRGIVLSNGEGK